MNEQMESRWEEVRMAAAGLVFILGALFVGLFLAWRAMAHVSPDGARAWALGATILLLIGVPAAARAGYRLGRIEARGKLDGIDAGVERVM